MDKTGKTISIIAAAVVLAVVWCVWGRRAAAEIAYPVENGASWFARNIVAPLRGVARGASAQIEADSLRREKAALEMAAAECESLRTENARLRKTLYGSEAAPFRGKWICAPVLSHGGAAGARRIVRAGRGSLHGVRPDCPAAVSGGLVGRVVEVSPHSCTILLAEDETSKVACTFKRPDGVAAFGILSGGGVQPGETKTRTAANLAFVYSVEPMRLEHLEAGLQAPAGTEVFTSGLGGVFPPGLKVGRISEIWQPENGICSEALVEPAVDSRNLQDLFLLVEDR